MMYLILIWCWTQKSQVREVNTRPNNNTMQVLVLIVHVSKIIHLLLKNANLFYIIHSHENESKHLLSWACCFQTSAVIKILKWVSFTFSKQFGTVMTHREVMWPLRIPGLPRFSGSTTLTANTFGANLKERRANEENIFQDATCDR